MIIVEGIRALQKLLEPKGLAESKTSVIYYEKLAMGAEKRLDHVQDSNSQYLEARKTLDLYLDQRSAAMAQVDKWEERFEFRKKLLSAIIDVSVLGPIAVIIARGLGY